MATALILAGTAGRASAGAISLKGQLDAANPQDVFVTSFVVAAPTAVTIQSWGFGGSAGAPGGTNAAGTVIGAGGFDPYVSLFAGTGPTATFVASNDDGSCPPGTRVSGACLDSTLSVNLPAGTYTLAVTAFLNMSFAENYGTGTLGDGFVGLGSFGSGSVNFAVDIAGPSLVTATLQSATSRKVHGAGGTFDLPLSLLATNPTIEPRTGPAQTLVFTFDQPVVAAVASVTEGSAVAAAPAFSGNEVVVGLTGVANQQWVTVSLSNVATAGGGTGGSGSVRLGFLAGDVNQSRVVSIADLGLVNAQLAQPVTASNFLKDVNASGAISLSDKGLANANLTKALPAP